MINDDTIPEIEKFGAIAGLMVTAFNTVSLLDELPANVQAQLDDIMEAARNNPYPIEFEEIGEIAAEHGNIRGALKLLNEIVELSPGAIDARFTMAKIHNGQGDHDKALHILNEMLKETGTDQEPDDADYRTSVLLRIADTHKLRKDNVGEWNTVMSMQYVNQADIKRIDRMQSAVQRGRAQAANTLAAQELGKRLYNIRRRMDRAGQKHKAS